MPESSYQRSLISWLRLLEDLIPFAKTHQRLIGHRSKKLEQGRILQHLWREFGGDLACCLNRGTATSSHRFNKPEEVNVVRIVADGVEALNATLGNVFLVSPRGEFIGPGRVSIAPNPRVDMGWHVHQVTGARDKILESVSSLFSALRIFRGLHQMDPKVQRPWMIRVSCHYRLQDVRDLFCPRIWTTIWRPIIPGTQVHHCFGKQYRSVQIIWKLLVYLAHGIGVSMVPLSPLTGSTGIPLCQGLNIGLFSRGYQSLKCERFLHKLVRPHLVLRAHWSIDIWPYHEGLSPISHGTVRIESGSFPECPFGFSMIETISQVDALVDEFLSTLRFCRHWKCMLAQVK